MRKLTIGPPIFQQRNQTSEREPKNTPQAKKDLRIFNIVVFLIQFYNMDQDGPQASMVKHFMNQVKLQDLMNVGFMKPAEFALRTHKNDKEVPTDSLPQGMLFTKKNCINDNKYSLHRVTQVDKSGNLQALRKNHQDNYVSLLKKPEGTELAICVCMYSEDKPMLKRTLEGIADNIDLLIEKGTNPDEIFVAIIIDGIQKVDESLFNYFEQFERESEIFLEDDDENTMRKKYEDNMVKTDFNESSSLNYSKFLFQEEEFNDRMERQFVRVREEYDKVARLRTQIQNIKKERNSANQNLKMILNKIIDQQKSALQAIADEEGIQETDFNITEESIMRELASSEEECNQYIAARDQLAYVSAYRIPTRSLSLTIRQRESQIQQAKTHGTTLSNGDANLRETLLQGMSTYAEDSKAQNPVRRNKKYVNMYFIIKYKNAGKLSSHNWFFNGLCNELKPKYAILLDVGLRPYPQALYKMYHYMKKRPGVGGVCGYMSLKAEKVEDQEMHRDQDLDWLSRFCLLFFDIQKAQQIEYHFAHLIDKPFESIFKFIHVLPGAFSGYSMQALRPRDRRDALLRQYFKSIDQKLATNKVVPSNFTMSQIIMRVLLPKFIWKIFKPVDPDSEEQVLYNQNIYLAEDRILCMGIHKNEKDIIFMPDAYAQVDPIKTVNGLMGQRKRWINGSMFAFEKVQKEMENFKSEKMAVIDMFLKLQIFYLNLSNTLVYFAPAILLFTFHLTMQTIRADYLGSIFAISNPTGIGSVIYATFVNVMDFLYALMFFGIIFLSIHLTHSNKKFIYYIYFFSTVFGLFSVITFVVILVDIIKGFAGGNNFIQQEYESQLNAKLKGAGNLINILRYFIVSSMAFYVIPLVLYGIFFFRLKYFWEIITGTFSFIFYSPSYLNLLNIYALCRIDDISWGTKGLDASVGGKNAKLKETWKVVKMIDVAKFFIWNIIVGTIFLVFDGYIIIKFFITLFLLILFTAIQAVKIIIGVCYLVKYRFITAKKNVVQRSDIQGATQQEDPLQTTETKFHIYDILDIYAKDLKDQIQFSFRIAAAEKEEQEAQFDEGQPKIQVTPAVREGEAQKFQAIIVGDKKADARNSRMSKQVVMAFQQNRFQNIRQANQIKRDYYPEGSRRSRAVKMNEEDNSIQVHLLHRKFEQEMFKKAEVGGRQASRRIEKIRDTFMMNMQSKRFG